MIWFWLYADYSLSITSEIIVSKSFEKFRLFSTSNFEWRWKSTASWKIYYKSAVIEWTCETVGCTVGAPGPGTRRGRLRGLSLLPLGGKSLRSLYIVIPSRWRRGQSTSSSTFWPLCVAPCNRNVVIWCCFSILLLPFFAFDCTVEKNRAMKLRKILSKKWNKRTTVTTISWKLSLKKFLISLIRVALSKFMIMWK